MSVLASPTGEGGECSLRGAVWPRRSGLVPLGAAGRRSGTSRRGLARVGEALAFLSGGEGRDPGVL